MKLKYSFEEIHMGNDIILIPVGDESDMVHGVLKANNEGNEIINLLKAETTEDDIIEKLSLKYDNSREILAEYVHNTIQKLEENGLII